MVSSNYFYLIIIIHLQAVIWFQVTNNNLLKKLKLQVAILNINSLLSHMVSSII